VVQSACTFLGEREREREKERDRERESVCVCVRERERGRERAREREGGGRLRVKMFREFFYVWEVSGNYLIFSISRLASRRTSTADAVSVWRAFPT